MIRRVQFVFQHSALWIKIFISPQIKHCELSKIMLGFCRYFHVLFVILLMRYSVYAKDSQSCKSDELDAQCGVFCYKLFKPVLLDTVEFRQQIEEYREKYHDVGEKMETMQQNATRQENVINYQTDQIARLNIKIDKYEDTIRDRESEIRILIDINNKYKIELENKDMRIKSLESNIEEINKKSRVEYGDRDNQIKKLQSELKDKNNLLESSQKEITLLTNQSESSAKEVNKTMNEITSLRSDLESRDVQISEYRKKEGKCSAESCLAFLDSRIAGPGWMVIQRRIDGSVDCNRTWQDYKQGFGDVGGEFWLGLETLHQLTTSRRYELYVQVIKMEDDVLYAKYDNFEIDCEAEQYKLKSLGMYSGNAWDLLRKHEGRGFTTLYRHNDDYTYDHNVIFFGGAWWHNTGKGSNLNAVFGVTGNKIIFWDEMFKSAQMFIRPWQLD